MAEAIGAVLRRPSLFPTPAFAVSGLFGEMGKTLLLEGAKVRPVNLAESGFPFFYPQLESALASELGVITPW